MDKKIAGLLGAAAALTTVTAAQAAVPPQGQTLGPATSYQDLLETVPNAVAALKADNARLAETPAVNGVRLAYHHHHHHVLPWFLYHHHHHHHHYSHHHHHHHHHHHSSHHHHHHH